MTKRPGTLLFWVQAVPRVSVVASMRAPRPAGGGFFCASIVTPAQGQSRTVVRVSRAEAIRTQESVPALSKSRHEHFREHFLHSLSILGKGGQPLVRKRLWRKVVDFAQHSLLQPFHDSGLDGFDIGQAEEGPGLSRRALNVNVDGCLHGRVALQSLDGAAFRSEHGGRQGSAAMPGLPWLAGSAMKLYTESQVRSKI